MVRAVLSGERGGCDGPRYSVARDLVVLNAAAALHVRTGDGLLDCAARAQRAIDDGSALHKLQALVSMSQVVMPQASEGAAE